PFPERRLIVGALLARPHVAREQLEDQLPRLRRALGLCRDFHARGRLADARRRQHALALDLDHACAAVTVDPVARHVDVTQVRNLRAFALRDVPDGFAGPRRYVFAIELECDRIAHFTESFRNSVSKWATGLGAAWPRPQIDESRMTASRSRSAGSFNSPLAFSNPTILSVPSRQGVHWPQLSCLKNFNRLTTASLTSSRSENTTTACEPTNAPILASSPPKSSGMSPIDAGRIPPEAPPGR